MLIMRDLGMVPYDLIWENMKQFTSAREPSTPDECWMLEHHPVYTQGQAGKAEHLLNSGGLPVIQSDRGGQVTYHGPGQLVCYVLLNLPRLGFGVRDLVNKLEQLLIQLLSLHGIEAHRKDRAPGVYVEEKKIASIGLRVKNGYTYHGIALNTDMDLTPFKGINPCGFTNMQVTQIKDYVANITLKQVKEQFQQLFLQEFATQP